MVGEVFVLMTGMAAKVTRGCMFVNVQLYATVGASARRTGRGVSSTLGVQRGVGGRFGIDLVPVVVVVDEGVIDGSQRETGECCPQFLRRDALTQHVLDHTMQGEAASCDMGTAATDCGTHGDMRSS